MAMYEAGKMLRARLIAAVKLGINRTSATVVVSP